ncbi:hypothetical protein NLJ89_g9201 [Agrocybe chaxingu]|uniref:Chromo domain-containing protein n=1 Tax=Agrocybe chaxingu TaxID=84603 RepID=A0A9W8K112_9AGAR|nr:hypothetical protein NLJ89_g9201 [Agrocybe chaxingu]
MDRMSKATRKRNGLTVPSVLEEGQVHIRITMARKGVTTPIHGDVIIVRNPCLRPGDILKLRAVRHPKLDHLVDCLVFASQARPGRHAPPSMSSGGDLDGDEFFVCWDADIVPTTISESYDYPGNKEFNKKGITRIDLGTHFASYNASGVARVSALHAKWACSSLNGALCVQCQELNDSQSVILAKGAKVMITRNIWQDQGIVNATTGVVEDVRIWAEGSSRSELPIAVLVSCKTYRSPTLWYTEPRPGFPTRIPIIPITPFKTMFEMNGKTLSRTQLPLWLAWAATIHKSQGLTLGKIKLGLGKKEFLTGLTFVALSRVKAFDGIMITDQVDYPRVQNLEGKHLQYRLDDYYAFSTSGSESQHNKGSGTEDSLELGEVHRLAAYDKTPLDPDEDRGGIGRPYDSGENANSILPCRISGSFFPISLQTPNMDVHQKLFTGPTSRILPADTVRFGIPYREFPAQPPDDTWVYEAQRHILHHPGTPDHLIAPEAPAPPPQQFYPLAPEDGYHLEPDDRYLRGYVYWAGYDLSKLDVHRNRLVNIATPPEIHATLRGDKYEATPVPGMIQMVPGVPYVFRYNGDRSRTHTFGCLHTLESLSIYPDFDDILDASVSLAKLIWGCPAQAGLPEVPPVYTLPGLKVNDRSTARAPFNKDSLDGSYNLGSTVMKGEGMGTFLPAIQANSLETKKQIRDILQIVHRLRQLILPKCLSRFELEITNFYCNYNNTLSFGGESLINSIGEVQGAWHPDISDDVCLWTFYTLLLRIGPTGDPGPFCLARGGIYCRELNAWIIFLVFKGTDLHSGFAPLEDREAHMNWVNTELNAAWNLAGPQNRVGLVNYPGALPIHRLGSLNVSPPTRFGNYGSSAPHKTTQANFSEHGDIVLGNADAYSNRLGREAVMNFVNSVSFAGLSLNLDPDELLQKLTYQDPVDFRQVPLKQFPHHPIHDKELICHNLSLYHWHSNESHLFNLHITKKALKDARKNRILSATESLAVSTILELPELTDCGDPVDFEIEHVVAKTRVKNQIVYTVILKHSSELVNIPSDNPSIKGNPIILNWVKENFPPSINAARVIPNVPEEGETCSTNRQIEDRDSVLAPNSSTSSLTNINGVTLTPIPTSPMVSEESRSHTSAAINEDEITATPLLLNQKRSAKKRKMPATFNEDLDNERRKLRPRKGKREQELESSCPVNQDTDDEAQEFEVESILQHKINELGIHTWFVKWKNYSSDHNSWVEEENLSNCLQLLADFNKSCGVDTLEKSNNNSDTLTKNSRMSGAAQVAANLDTLCYLLDGDALDKEIASLFFWDEFEQTKLPSSSSFDIQSMLSLWAEHHTGNQSLLDLVPILPTDSMSTNIVKFELMQRAMVILQPMGLAIRHLDLLGRAFRQEMCRSLIAAFDWYTTSGPQLASRLMQIHQNGGYKALAVAIPLGLAKLVDHVVQHVYYTIQTDFHKRREVHKKKGSKNAILDFPVFDAWPSKFFNSEPILNPSKLPFDLYGVRIIAGKPTHAHHGVVNLRPSNFRGTGVSKNPIKAMYESSQVHLEEIWSTEILIPQLRFIDAEFSKKRSKFEDKNVRERSITRGAILACVAEACGSDGIFASTRIGQ